MTFLKMHLLSVVVPLVVMGGLGALLKSLPALLEKKAISALELLFKKGDAADDAFLIALIKWADAKYGPASGAKKASAVVDKIVVMLPIQYRAFMSPAVRIRAVQLFQECFDRIEAAALKEADGHSLPADAVPPVPPPAVPPAA